MKKSEKDSITEIAIIGMQFENVLRIHQSINPDSIVLALLRGTFAGLIRDSLDATINNDLKTLAKYWLLAAAGANIEKDNPTKEQVEAFNKFKLKVQDILKEETEITWPNFDQI